MTGPSRTSDSPERPRETDGAGAADERSAEPTYGDAWVYESITGAVPGVDLSPWAAVALQFAVFEAAVVALAVVYDLWAAVPTGTAAVAVAAVGSVFMQRIGATARAGDLPGPYRRALFGSSIEVVLGLFAFVGLVTYLFVVDTGAVSVPFVPLPASGDPLLVDLLGDRPPAPAVFVLLFVLWDVCYRIGTGWWTSVVAASGATSVAADPAAARTVRRTARLTSGFALTQLALVPFVWGHPLLVVLLVGHVAAVLLVAGVAYARTGA